MENEIFFSNVLLTSIKYLEGSRVRIIIFTENRVVFLARELQAISDPYSQAPCLYRTLSA